MRYLLLSSCLLIIAGCSPVYKNLVPAKGDVNSISKLRPDFKNALYKAEIEVTNHHLSGLLLIKTLPDNSIRMVFSSEMGFKFFDFEFRSDGGFKVYYILKQMDKKPVIKTLRKDFELIMLRKQDLERSYLRMNDKYIYYISPQPKGFYCFITDKEGSKLVRSEIASSHKPIVQAIMENFKNGVPDTIGITHKNFKFTIGLKRIER